MFTSIYFFLLLVTLAKSSSKKTLPESLPSFHPYYSIAHTIADLRKHSPSSLLWSTKTSFSQGWARSTPSTYAPPTPSYPFSLLSELTLHHMRLTQYPNPSFHPPPPLTQPQPTLRHPTPISAMNKTINPFSLASYIHPPSRYIVIPVGEGLIPTFLPPTHQPRTSPICIKLRITYPTHKPN